jgi:hypothetical protein
MKKKNRHRPKTPTADSDWLMFFALLFVFPLQHAPKSHVSLTKNQQVSLSFSSVCVLIPTMDPERVRAYLQVACAGLGFDIGEVWWTSNENGSSTVAAIGG